MAMICVVGVIELFRDNIMTDKKLLTKRSKFLSLVLRHKPEKINITLDKNGWVPVLSLLSALDIYGGMTLTLEELKEIVETNDKKRFAFSADGAMIRANQGHSVEVDLDWPEQTPDAFLYHGTVQKYLDDIKAEGLKKMNRHHVHLSNDISTAINVGARRGQPVILVIDAKSMCRNGHKFYLSDNGVWLTDRVPSKYIIYKMEKL